MELDQPWWSKELQHANIINASAPGRNASADSINSISRLVLQLSVVEAELGVKLKEFV